MSQIVVRALVSGVYQLCGLNSGRPLVQIEHDPVLDFSGTVVFSKNTGTVSNGVSLTSIPVRERGGSPPVDSAAGVSFYAAGAVEPDTDGLPLYATVVVNSGAVIFTVFPEWAGTLDAATIPLSSLDLSVIPMTYPEDLAFQLEVANTNALDVSASS
jgi:hypothetical protein